MIEVTYHYSSILVCGCGCCHENNSYVAFSSEYKDDEVNSTFYDYADLELYLEARFGASWKEQFYINVDECSFY